MQFKYPELLYAFFLLLIPIFIHLFQLRKFEKVAFTNVKFLKKVELQTRKSAKLKKFLVLLTRLLFLSFLILAFAQPFFGKKNIAKNLKTIIYLDNSLSMQAKAGSVSLLEEAKQELVTNLDQNDTRISLLTNSDFYPDLSKKELKNTILSLSYYPISKDIETVLQRIPYSVKEKKKTNLILISDFKGFNLNKLDSTINYHFVKLQASNQTNYALDSLFIAKQSGNDVTINLLTSASKKEKIPASFSLYNNNRLLGKSSVSFTDKKQQNILFKVSDTQINKAKAITNDHQLEFDNSLYFTFDKPNKIRVLVIGKKNTFLSKIYTKDQFIFTSVTNNQIDYTQIQNQNTIILNELTKIALPLQKELQKFVKNGGSLLVIPSNNIDIQNYNLFFKSLNLGSITSKNNQNLKINKIVFSHPVLKGVFEKKILNFQYPNIKTWYKTNFKTASGILKLENQNSLIAQINYQNGKVFWLSSPINSKESNFKNSPLIVPIFYNIGAQSFKINQLYYLIGTENTIDIKASISKDQVVKIQQENDPENSFIPLQQVFNNKVRITLNEFPLKAGFYNVYNNNQIISKLAFNYLREENKGKTLDLSTYEKFSNISISDSINNVLEQINDASKTKKYWKKMLLFALLFLIMEMLIIKFWKN